MNGDGKVKIAIYNGDEIFGNSATSDIISFARQLQTDPPVLIEQHKHSISADVNAYNWAADLDRLTNTVSETTNTIDAVPDFIVAATFAQYDIPHIKTWQLSGYNQRVPRMAFFHTFRIQSAVDALGALGITLMLATWRAAHALPVPTAVTGDQIRQAMLGIAEMSRPMIASRTPIPRPRRPSPPPARWSPTEAARAGCGERNRALKAAVGRAGRRRPDPQRVPLPATRKNKVVATRADSLGVRRMG